MKIFYPKGLADICAIPKSLIGRTLALGALAGISGGAVLGAWHILWRAIGVMAYGSGLVFESRGAAAAHALRSVAQGIVFLLNSAALSCVGLAAVWLAVYMVFRFARNSQMQNLQYFRIWVVALVLAFPLSIALDAWEIFVEGAPGTFKLGSMILNAVLFVVFLGLAKFSFIENPPKGGGAWKEELSKVEFVGILRKSIRAHYPHFKRNAVVAVLVFAAIALVAGA